MRLKPDVVLANLRPQTVLAMQVAESVIKRIAGVGFELRITSGSDGKHPGKPVAGEATDPHYTGRAFDFGIKDIPEAMRQQVIFALADALGPQYRVFHESIGQPNEHGHVQYEGAI